MSLALLFHYLMLNIFRMLIHPSSGPCDLFVELFHGLYCSVRIEVIALACLFNGECLVVTCVVVLESVFLQILAAAVSCGYWVFCVCSVLFDNVSWIYSDVVYMSLHIPGSMCVHQNIFRKHYQTTYYTHRKLNNHKTPQQPIFAEKRFLKQPHTSRLNTRH